jgi:regulator of RNase E activity RraB
MAQVQLSHKGERDAYITGHPQITFFKGEHRRHVNFAYGNKEIDLNIDFGNSETQIIPKTMDLIGKISFETILPKLNENYRWVTHIGLKMIKRIVISFDDVVVSDRNGEYLYLRKKLELLDNSHYNDMIGNDKSWGPKQRTINVPLDSWFDDSETHIKMRCIENQNVNVYIELEELSKLIQMRDVEKIPNVGLSKSKLYIDVVHLDEKVQEDMKVEDCLDLITQVQMEKHRIDLQDNREVTLDLNFRYGCTEMFWVAENPQSSMFEYIDVLENCHLTVNDETLFNRSKRFYTYLQPYKYFKKISQNIYYLSFCLKPKERQPSGSINFDLIKNKKLTVKVSDNYKERFLDIKVYAVNHNFINYKKGVAKMITSFSSEFVYE